MTYNIQIYSYKTGELMKDLGSVQTMRQAEKVAKGVEINLHQDAFVKILENKAGAEACK